MRNLVIPVVILVAFLLLGLAYGVMVPPFENLDEIEHFGVIRYIAEMGHLPVHGDPREETYHYRQEASQPPLYHLLSAALVRLLGLRSDDAAEFWRFNPHIACGPNAPNFYDNRAIFYHNPHREFPWRGTLLTVHALRLWSTLLQAVTVVGTYALARRIFPRHPHAALLSTAIVALNPQFLFVAGGINNDNLVTPLVTLVLYGMAGMIRQGLSWRRSLTVGVGIALAGLSKLSGWLLVPLAGLLFLVLALRSRRRCFLTTLIHIGLITVPAILIGGWWFWRNWHLYGDPTALAPMLRLVGLRGSPIYPWNEFGLVFRSFWGQIPCSFYPALFYLPYILLTVAGTAGLILYWIRNADGRWGIVFLAGWVLLVLIGWIRWDLTTPAPGGRLLFPALPALAILWAVGIGAWGRPRLVASLTAAGLALLAWWTVGRIIPAFFAPPPLLSPDRARWTHPSDAAWRLTPQDPSPAIRLLGYDVALNESDPSLDVTLYWQATRPIGKDYSMALQLVSPVPGDDTLRWTYDSWPGGGNYPTSAWLPGKIIRDHYRFRLPAADFPTQAWDLQLVLYGSDMRSLPLYIGDRPAERLILGRYRLPGKEPLCPESAHLSTEVRLGEHVALTHAEVLTDSEGVQVTLCWKSLTPLDRDYHVFVHLYDASGAWVTAGDGPPMGGAFPTTLWKPGDTILDVHHLPFLIEGGRIAVGMYHLEDGTRLPVTIGGKPVPDAAIPIWPTRP